MSASQTLVHFSGLVAIKFGADFFRLHRSSTGFGDPLITFLVVSEMSQSIEWIAVTVVIAFHLLPSSGQKVEIVQPLCYMTKYLQYQPRLSFVFRANLQMLAC